MDSESSDDIVFQEEGRKKISERRGGRRGWELEPQSRFYLNLPEAGRDQEENFSGGPQRTWSLANGLLWIFDLQNCAT